MLGELSEELGTVRGKIAGRLNETVFKPGRRWRRQGSTGERLSALTSDVGLQVFVVPGEVAQRPEQSRAPVKLPPIGCAKVLCTTCHIDTDRGPKERYHRADRIYEVCVKGENEGIFYNCGEHDPGNQLEPLFLEQLERFDVFGR